MVCLGSSEDRRWGRQMVHHDMKNGSQDIRCKPGRRMVSSRSDQVGSRIRGCRYCRSSKIPILVQKNADLLWRRDLQHGTPTHNNPLCIYTGRLVVSESQLQADRLSQSLRHQTARPASTRGHALRSASDPHGVEIAKCVRQKILPLERAHEGRFPDQLVPDRSARM
jgi:hypothetical protein